MKSIIRSLIINIFSLWATTQITSGFVFKNGDKSLIVAGLALGLVNLFIKPIINILLLPINLLTLGAFRWLVNVLALFLVTILVPDFAINGFNFQGFSYGFLSIPAFSAEGFMALILNSFVLSIISGLFYWIVK